ncbi:methylmalonyl-CoA mutase accessory protein [Syntrophobacter sp. SbD1]|nr:methylmalonyl-CoA mutase accessory protein [Syntrophobacter sp. SbD1]
MDIIELIVSGDVRTIARILRDIDDEIPSARDILRELYPHTGNAFVVGFTGSPGVGKSALVDQIAIKYRKEEKTVGILAVDPTSPFSGGAILGDRIRMQRHFLDPGVFIRSLATRGHFGGLSKSTNDMVNVLDAAGKDVILVETVGVGQDEVEIANSAHTTVLVTVPGMGDDIQAIKAGIMEIGNIFVVNKADREGSRKTVRELMNLIELSSRNRNNGDWDPQIVETEAIKGRGIDQLYEAIEKHKNHLRSAHTDKWREVLEKRARIQLIGAIRDEALKTILERIEGHGDSLDEMVQKVVDKESDPYTMVQQILDREFK